MSAPTSHESRQGQEFDEAPKEEKTKESVAKVNEADGHLEAVQERLEIVNAEVEGGHEELGRAEEETSESHEESERAKEQTKESHEESDELREELEETANEDDDEEVDEDTLPSDEEERGGYGMGMEDRTEGTLKREDVEAPGREDDSLKEATHRRRHCPSFRLLLRRQLWVNTVKMAATIRKLFRSRRSTQGGKRKRGEVGEGTEDPPRTPTHASSPTRRIFPTLIEGSNGKVGPSEPLVGAAASSPRVLRRDQVTSSPSVSPAKASFGSFFKKNQPPLSPLPPTAPAEPNAKHMKLVRSRRLLKEFHELTKTQLASEDPVFTVDLVSDCLYEWKVKLYRIDPESELFRDMVEFNVPYILLNLSFPEAFPFQPPFLRVLAPRLEKGFVMEGGAICMELLTPRGWASAYTIEAVIMQFAASLVKGQGRISRKHRNSKEFNKRSAEASFRSLVKTHEKYGWVTPPLAEG